MTNDEKKIMELEGQLVTLINRLEFEANMYEKRLAKVKTGIYEKIRRGLQLELDGIENILKKFPDKEADELSRWVANIQQIVDISK